MKSQYDAGLNRVYELVLPTNPSVAFLLDTNTPMETTLVKAHVLGHADFSHNNRFFKVLSPNIHELAAARAERIRTYEARYGRDRVEALLTAALTVAHHVEPEPYVGWREVTDPERRTDEFPDLWQIGRTRTDPRPAEMRRVWTPTNDILQVIVHETDHLKDWERDVVQCVREDSLYFWPIIKTKIMNEGWATFWHLKIIHELDLTDREAMEFAQLHSGVAGSHGLRLNPYHLGLIIWRSIEKIHGRDAMFEIRETLSDSGFLRNYLTRDIVVDEGLYAWKPRGDEIVATAGIDAWERVRDAIANEVAMALPQIEVTHIGTERELVLTNRSGRALDKSEANEVLKALRVLWGRQVELHDQAQGTVLVA